jgi:hypothetical protein
MELFLRGNYRTTQQASWIVGYCVELHPRLADPWLKAMIKRMQEPDLHVAVRRNVLRILRFVQIPKQLQGTVTTLCFDYIRATDSPIAVRAFSMYVLANIAKQEPDLENELRLVLKQVVPYGSGAIQACARKVLRQLDR